MEQFLADITVEKMVEKDNWTKGCYGGTSVAFLENMTVSFTDKEDLKNKLADIAADLGVDKQKFLKYVDQDEANPSRFQYNQNEDSFGNYKKITMEDPDGYLADYFFWVNKVYQPVDFKF